MAYLSEENTNTYLALLAGGRFGADVEPGEPIAPSTSPGGSYGNPMQPSTGPIRTTGAIAGPIKTTPSKFTPRSIPGKVITESPIMVGKDTFTPKSFTQATTTSTSTAEIPGKTNIMPLVYLGGAGLLLYYLFKK